MEFDSPILDRLEHLILFITQLVTVFIYLFIFFIVGAGGGSRTLRYLYKSLKDKNRKFQNFRTHEDFCSFALKSSTNCSIR